MYVGIPFKEKGRDESGLDCWGLVRLWYKNELGVDLPSYLNVYSHTKEKVVAETIAAESSAHWRSVDTPERGDVVLLRVMGLPWHVGVYLGGNKFLHVQQGCDSIIENLDSTRWRNRILGYVRMK